MVKKLIGLLTVSVMFLSMIVIPASASDSRDPEYWTTMESFGVIEPGTSSGSTFTIADMSKMLYRLMNVKAPVEPEATRQIYVDVDRWHWAAGYSEWLYNHSIYAGNGNGELEPDRTAMLSDVYTVVLNVLGYKHMLDNVTPEADIISSAVRFGLIPNNVGNTEHEITYGEFASICYKMLFTKIIEPEFGAKSGYKTKGEFIDEVLDIQYRKGIITGANGYSLDNNECGIRQVIVNHHSYEIKSDESYYRYLGYNVKYYYDIDESELIAVVPMANTEISIDSKDIIEYDNDTYKYEINGRTKTAKHTDPVLLLYNGRITANRNAFTPEYGRVRLIDNDSDGRFDVVISENAFNIILEKVAGDIIYGKNTDGTGKKYAIDLSDFTLTEFIGNSLPISDLKEGTVISAVISEDGKYGRFYISETKLSGKLETVNSETYTVSGKEYYISNDVYDMQIVSLGASVYIYLDVYGKIAAITSETDDKYAFAYLMSVYNDDIEDKLLLKLLTENGIIKKYTTERVVINGMKASSTNSAEYSLTPHIGKLIRYRLNEGEIRFVDTTVNISGFDETETPSGNNSLRMIAEGKMRYTAYPQLFKCNETTMPTYAEFAVDDSTKVFYVPAGDYYDEDADFYVGDISYLYDDLEASVEGYVTGKSTFTAEAVVVRYNSNVLVSTPFTAVSKIIESVNAEGDNVSIIHGMSGGKDVDLIVKDETLLTKDGGIDKGSIIRCRTDKNGEVKSITNIYGVNGIGELNTKSLHEYNQGSGSGRYSNVRAVLGYVYDHDGTIARFKFKDEVQKDEIFNLKNCNFYVCNDGRVQLRAGTIDDIHDYLHYGSEYDEVIICTRGVRTVDVYLIRQ